MAYRWFLGYNLLDRIPHFATVSYAFCKRFPPSLTEEIFEHILNKAINNRMVEPSAVFIDGTHIKASANKKKFQKEQVKRAAKVYDEQLRREVNEEREKLGKKPINNDDDDSNDGGTVEKTVSTTDPECGMFVKGEHERQFAYEAHTACDENGFILGVEVTAGNVNDSVAWDKVYEEVTERFPESKYIVMDAGYKTPWIAKRTLEDDRIPVLPYTRKNYKDGTYRPWEYDYDPVNDSFTCPHGGILRHTTTDKEGKRTLVLKDLQFFLDHMSDIRTPSVGLAALRMFHHMANIFRDTTAQDSTHMGLHIDRKRRRELQEKRIAMGHKPDDHEDERMNQTMG